MIQSPFFKLVANVVPVPSTVRLPTAPAPTDSDPPILAAACVLAMGKIIKSFSCVLLIVDVSLYGNVKPVPKGPITNCPAVVSCSVLSEIVRYWKLKSEIVFSALPPLANTILSNVLSTSTATFVAVVASYVRLISATPSSIPS